MAKTVSDSLFRLIKSLTPHEKRYFKIYSALQIVGKENNYVRLFDAIDKQETFDEEAIKKQFRKETFVKQLHVTKNRLHEAIMNSLHNYHLDLSSDSILKKQMHQASILIEKGLYEESEKLLVRIKSKATALEKYIYVFESISLKMKIILARYYEKITKEELSNIFNEGYSVLNKIKNLHEYRDLSGRYTFLYSKKGEVRNKDDKSQYDAIMNHPLLNNENNATTNASKRIFNNLWLAYYNILYQDFPNAHKYASILLKLTESVPEQIIDDPEIYAVPLYNLMLINLANEQYNESLTIIKKLRSIGQKFKINLTLDLQRKIFINSYICELQIYGNTGAFEKINLIVNSIEEGFKKFSNKIPDKIGAGLILYKTAYLYFGLKEYKKSIEWLNRIFNNSDLDMESDGVGCAKILQLIVYIELNDIDLLPHILKSSKHFLNKKNKLYKAETIIFNFVKHFLKVKTKDELLNLHKETKNEFLKIMNDSFEKKVLGYFDFISWFDSKIENRSFAEIVKEKAKR